MASELRFLGLTGDHWLPVRLDGYSLPISLHYGMKVQWDGIKGNREYFTVLEGPYKGVKGNAQAKGPNLSWFVKDILHRPAGFVRFNRKQQALWFGGQGPYNAFSGEFTHPTDKTLIYTQVPKGTYPLCIPDFPHAATRAAYSQWTTFHKSWFLIDNCPGNDKTASRYLHTGEISEGCVTVRAFVFDEKAPPKPSFEDLSNFWLPKAPGGIGVPYPAGQAPAVGWDQIYNYLVLCRANDKHVGKITVE